MKFRPLSLALLTTGALLLSGCGPKPPSHGTVTPKAQELVRQNTAEPQSLDPQKVQGVPGSTVDADMFEGLLSFTPDGGIAPGVAKRWKVKNNGLTYLFHLRKDAKWSDGSPVTAKDFVYAWQRAVDPATGSSYAFYMEITGIKNAKAIIDGKAKVDTLGVEALDANTLKVSLSHPVPYFLNMLPHTTLYPVPQAVVEKWTRAEHMISNGAFQLDQWVVNEKIVLKRNPYYWNNTKTRLDKVTFRPIADGKSSLNQYRSGQLDT